MSDTPNEVKRGKLSLGERKERAKARQQEREAQWALLPHAALGGGREGNRFHVLLEAGDENWLAVRAKWDGEKWSNREVDVSDIGALANFIAALCARLNFHIAAANEDIRKINSAAVNLSERITRDAK